VVHPYRQPHRFPPERRGFPVHYLGVAALLTLLGSLAFVHVHYAKPHCAVTDCATGQIVDNGCVNGVCLSCTNACAQFN
jgi:hypothetical protein